MINLKDNIFIESFSTFEEADIKAHEIYPYTNEIGGVYYCGKLSNIPEERAKKYVKNYPGLLYYFDYRDLMYEKFETAKESLKTACPREYCIIYVKQPL